MKPESVNSVLKTEIKFSEKTLLGFFVLFRGQILNIEK